MTVFLFFSSFVYYLFGLSGTVPAYRDSGDLIASIYTLGIAHPPGYALYVLLGKLFITILPFGNVAYRVNVMSAFFAAAAVAVLFRVLHRLGSGFGALVVTLLFAASPAVTALARVAEMYTLSAFLTCLILSFLLSDDPQATSWAALLLGLGLSVHPTLIFLLPLFVWAYRRIRVSAPTRRTALTPSLFFLLGLSVFLYLPIRAAQHPLLNWGDPSHWRNFWRVVTRADYGGLKLHPQQSVFSWTPGSLAAQLKYFLITFKGEWGWAAFLVGCWGGIVSLRDPLNRPRNLALVVSWFLAGPGFFLLSNLPLTEATTPAILQPYLILTALLWAPFVVIGLNTLDVIARSGATKQSVMTDCFASLAMTILCLILLVTRPWSFQSQRNDFYAYDYARNLLRSLPSHAVLYDPDDPTRFSIQVLQTVEKRRPDVILLSFFRTRWGYEEIKRRWPDLLPPIPIDNGQELQRLLWEYSARRVPFYAELPQKLGSIPYHALGLVYEAAPHPAPSPSRGEGRGGGDIDQRKRAESLLEIYVQRGDFVTTHHADFFLRHVISYYAAAQNNLGIEYANAGAWSRAAQHYQNALQIEPDQAAAHNNLAIALQRMRKLL